MITHLHVKTLSLVSAILLISTLTPVVSSTSPPPPDGVPILISPAAGAVMDNGCKGTPEGITWDFDWSDVPGVTPTQYHLKVWRNPALPVINKSNIMTSSYQHTSTPSTFIINTNLTGWRWMVRAKVLGVWGAWTPVRSFKVERLNTDCP